MSEDKTKEIKGSKSFEERVFARFDALEGRVDRIEVRFEQRFASVDHGLDSVGQHLTSVDHRLERLEAKQYDTKPVWERVLFELEPLKDLVGNLDRNIGNLHRKFEVLSMDMLQLRADRAH